MTKSDDLRIEYELAGLSEADVDPDPLVQFGKWYDEARAANVREPHAMALATASREGAPSARIVLLRGFDARGFVFFTNYDSDKARDLDANPRAALLFAWLELERQIRIEGIASRVSREETDAYFRTRPRASQLGAWASPQSRAIASRRELDDRFADLVAEYEGREVPAPPNWGGFRVAPTRYELWQGRPSRLHDRLSYVRDGSRWRIQRLAP